MLVGSLKLWLEKNKFLIAKLWKQVTFLWNISPHKNINRLFNRDLGNIMVLVVLRRETLGPLSHLLVVDDRNQWW